jgi:tRNA threonylcarbamoyladenosine biosynthesis protein TsaE
MNALGESMLIRTTSGEDDTRSFGKEFSAQLHSGDCVALFGALGSGKTRFVQGVCEGIGSDSAASSPTFTLVHEYRGGRMPVYHFDLYRIRTTRELIDLAIEEYLDGDGVCLIEWAEHAQDLLPARRFDVVFKHGATALAREISVFERAGVTA